MREDEIELLDGIEAVRMRPRMYVGELDSKETLSCLLEQCFCIALDDALDGHCHRVEVNLLPGGLAEVVDNSRGMPLTRNLQGVPSFMLLTTLYACRLKRTKTEVAERFCSIGLAVTNALSSELHVATHREGILWEQDFAKGRATSELRQRRVGGCGTRLSFRPDPEIFGATTFDRTDLEDRLEALRREFPQCTFDLHDARSLQ